jgi:cathepsin F
MQEFQQYIKDYDRIYDSLDQMTAKYLTFKDNYKKIKDLQAHYEGKKNKHEIGITKYMDMKTDTFSAQFMTAKISDEDLKEAKAADDKANVIAPDANQTVPTPQSPGTTTTNPPLLKATPTSWDWRTRGVVGPVKEQGACGSCWAHSASGNIESLYAIKYGTLYSLSVSQMLDCSYVNDGCVGGNQENAFKYLKSTGGLTTEAAYPYKPRVQTCRGNLGKSIAKVTGYFFAGSNEETMKNYVYSNGPLAVVFNANMLQYYKGGVITSGSATCSHGILNHAVLIVGYGSSNGQNYWIVKNSYGADWGENGYFKIARGFGTCGINQYVLSATIA